MAIDYTHGHFYLVCDGCGEVSVETFETWDAARMGAREIGWESRRDDFWDWVNVCPGCQEAAAVTACHQAAEDLLGALDDG